MVDLYLNDLMGVMPLLLDTFALEVKCCLLENTHYANPQTASLMAKLFFPLLLMRLYFFQEKTSAPR